MRFVNVYYALLHNWYWAKAFFAQYRFFGMTFYSYPQYGIVRVVLMADKVGQVSHSDEITTLRSVRNEKNNCSDCRISKYCGFFSL